MIIKRLWLGALLTLAGVGLYGCGTSCGTGTVELNGACVAECGTGLVMAEDGTCMAECAPNTTLNATTRVCEANIEGCATGTVAMGAECVPDGSVVCVGNTTYDEGTGTCVLSDSACADDLTLLDGECRDPDEILMADVMAAAEPDEPNFEGTPGSFLPPAVGETQTLGGCITPVDKDEDGELDPDIDWFTFSTATEGLYRVHADGLRGASAAFAIVATDGPLFDQGWYRIGMSLVNDSSERQVYLPRAGNYAILVFDSRSVNLDSLADEGIGFARPVGGEDTCYFVTIEAMERPAATPLTDNMAAGTLGDPEFFTTTASGETVFRGDLDAPSPSAFGAHTMIAEAGISAGTDLGVSPVVTDGESLLVVVDYVYNISLTDVPYTLNLSVSGVVPEDGAIDLVHDASDSLGTLLNFQATEGDVIHMVLVAEQEVEALLIRPDLGGAFAPCGSGFFGGIVPCDEADFYYVVEQTGTQLLLLDDPAAEDGASTEVLISRVHQTPVDVASGTPSTIALAGERTFVRVDASSNVWSNWQFSDFAGASFDSVDLRILNDQPGLIDDDAGENIFAIDAGFSRIHGTDLGTTMLFEFVDPASFDADEQFTLAFGPETYTDLTIDSTTPANLVGETLAADGVLYYFVHGVAGGVATLTATPAADVDALIEILDAEALPSESADADADGVAESLNVVVPAGGWFAVALRVFSTGGTVDLDITQAEPFSYGIAGGSTAFADICTDAAAVDLTAGFSDLDDGFSEVQSFDASLGLTFFGQEVQGMTVSSNGWLTFSRDYDGDSFIYTLGFGENAGGGHIAPFAADLISTEVCMLESATGVTVQWRGNLYGDAEATVEFQAIANTDGTIEIVYGSAQLADAPDAAGLEDQTGGLGFEPSDAITADSSFLFTPM